MSSVMPRIGGTARTLDCDERHLPKCKGDAQTSTHNGPRARYGETVRPVAEYRTCKKGVFLGG